MITAGENGLVSASVVEKVLSDKLDGTTLLSHKDKPF